MQSSPALREAIRKIGESIDSMKAASSLDEFEIAWQEFLHRTERFWNKSLNHYKKSPKWAGWSGRYNKQRNADDLLAYLINARGADEHTVEPITGRDNGGIGINPAEGNSLFIESMEIIGNQISIASPQAIKVTFYPSQTKLLPVTNRGRTYAVPSSHLGKPIDATNVVSIAESAHQYYSKFLDAAESFLCK